VLRKCQECGDMLDIGYLYLLLINICRFRGNEERCKDAVVISSVPVSQGQCYFEIGMS